MRRLDFDIIIIGAGMSGIGTAIALRKNGFKSFLILEKEKDIGGTWQRLDYPGIESDTLSYAYSYSFEPNTDWSWIYAPGKDINEYLHHCSNKYNVIPHVRLDRTVTHILFDDETDEWQIFQKDHPPLRARFVIAASSIYNLKKIPSIPGFNNFKGKVLWPTQWDSTYELDDKNVAVIGSGAAAIHIIPALHSKVKKLNVFQRNANWVLPKFNLKVPNSLQRALKYIPLLYKLTRFAATFFTDFILFATIYYKRLPFLMTLTEKVTGFYMWTQVKDSVLRKRLKPAYRLGCSRPLFSNDYYKTFNHDDVELITNPIKEITYNSIVTSDDEHHDVDVLIAASGFDVFAPGNYPGFKVYGVNNLELEDYWQKNRYQAYCGIAVPDFPNFFLTSGPHGVGLNWFSMIEPNITHILRCLKRAKKESASRIAIKETEHKKQFEKILKKSQRTVFNHITCSQADSYFTDNHGDISLPSPFLPLHRKFIAKFTSLDAFQFFPPTTPDLSSSLQQKRTPDNECETQAN